MPDGRKGVAAMLERLACWIEHFVILPIRWYRIHISNWREQRQQCKLCGAADGLNFTVPDEVWNEVVPPPLRKRVICMACFDRCAKQKEVDWATSLQELWFAGDKTVLKLRVAGSWRT